MAAKSTRRRPAAKSNTDEKTAEESKKGGWRKWSLWGLPVAGTVAMFAAGIIFWGGFNTAMEATNTLGFCISCHEMENTVYQEYKPTIHYQNRTGVRATCSDCHVPDPWFHKVVRKIEASRELYHKALGSIDTPAKFEAKRLALAKRVWASMKKTDSRECRNCHNFQSMNPEFQRPRARKQHLKAFETGQTCIDCHKGIAHGDVRKLLTEEELEELERPVVAHVRSIPPSFIEGMKRAEEREAQEAAKEEADKKVAAEALREQIEVRAKEIAAKEIAEQLAKTAGQAGATAPVAASSGGAATGSSSPIDWSGVEAKTVTLFYPGQASFEWIQTGKDHGGARAFKTGDRCAFCHIKEVKDMGAKLVSGEKVEPTPIPGKRGHVDVSVQAAHDHENVYFRFRWKNAAHTPAPFVDGGKMDPDNETKLAVMIAGTEIEHAELAGCWVTCHADSRYMPDHPGKDDIAAVPDAAGRLDVAEGITKYLAESRTKIEVRGRRGKKRGGWNKLKAKEEVDQLAEAGTFMDLIRYRSGGDPENGMVLAQRTLEGGAKVSAEGALSGDTWTVVMSRSLKSDTPGDVTLEPGKLYTIGIAIHDDYTSARFHHVSLEYTFGLDNPEAEINAVKK
ncbi:MAG: NapC/NirT family cytochrome c [Hyphomicrobiaceae bacterium]|nr:NapC/NirT family cytochrome c [Hyphomicrobiaceae bacterium]